MNIEALIRESIKDKCILSAIFFWVFKEKLIKISKRCETEKSVEQKKSPFVYNLR